jgi:hypothetical protein
MIKIVHWELDLDETDKLPDHVARRVADCCQWAALSVDRNGESVRVYASPPMPHYCETSQRIKDACRNVYSARLIDMTKNYCLVVTNAPERYDYGWCVSLGLCAEDPHTPKTDTPARLVAIPPEHADNQMARYASGLYWSRKAL